MLLNIKDSLLTKSIFDGQNCEPYKWDALYDRLLLISERGRKLCLSFERDVRKKDLFPCCEEPPLNVECFAYLSK